MADEKSLEKHVENNLMTFLGKYKTQIEQVLPKHMTPIRVMKLIVGQINRNPKLLQCTPMSVINAVLTAATMGLEIRPGSAYLVPFHNKKTGRLDCNLLIDYRAKIDLALRSAKVCDIDPEIVYSHDKFRVYRDERGRKCIEHEPTYFRRTDDGTMAPISEEDRGQPIGAYAVAELRDGNPKVVFMPAIDIDAIRKRSRSKDEGPWVTDPMEMWKKTVIHRICKTLPQAPELALSQEVDDRMEAGISLDTVIDVEAVDETNQQPLLPQSAEAAQEVAQRKITEMKARETAVVPANADEPPLDPGTEPQVLTSPEPEQPAQRKLFGGRRG